MTPPIQNPLAALPIRGLIAATSTVAVLGSTIGLGLPLLALLLESRGYGEGMIGLNATAQFLGIMGFSPLAPWTFRRFGLFNVMALSLAVCAACFALLLLFQSYGAWLFIRLIFGGAEGLLFVAGETWINQTIDDRFRARVTAIYGTVLATGFGIGPVIIMITGIDGPLPFLVAIALVLAGFGPLLLGVGLAPSIEDAPASGMLGIARALPVAVAAAMLFGLLDGGLIALLAVYGVAIGMDTTGAAQLLTTLIVGAVLLQIPIGWYADRVGRLEVLFACSVIGALFLVLAPFGAERGFPLYILLFGFGGLLGSFWTLSLALLGERFRGGDLAAGNVALTLAYGVGSVSGPAIGGFAMEVWSPHGLMFVFAAFTLCFAMFCIGARLRGG